MMKNANYIDPVLRHNGVSRDAILILLGAAFNETKFIAGEKAGKVL